MYYFLTFYVNFFTHHMHALHRLKDSIMHGLRLPISPYSFIAGVLCMYKIHIACIHYIYCFLPMQTREKRGVIFCSMLLLIVSAFIQGNLIFLIFCPFLESNDFVSRKLVYLVFKGKMQPASNLAHFLWCVSHTF